MKRVSWLLILNKYHAILFLISGFLLFLSITPSLGNSDLQEPYMAVSGLIDNRSTFSDGAHSIEELVRIAHSRGFKILAINDHNSLAIAYGVLPFRNILKYKKEFPSILTHGARKFLKEIDRVSKLYPDMIIIPGCETSPYYYWTGSYFKGNLTANDYDKRIIILNFNDPDDYNHIPNLHNKLSLKYTARLLPFTIVFLCLLFIGLFFMIGEGYYRIIGLILVILSVLAIVNYNPFRSSIFTQYDGDQGIAPSQELIDYANQRGGFTFWNYPEQLSGVRKHGPIYVKTPPYPQVLLQSKNYTGFAAVYGENTMITEPGREWDMVLNQYCHGERARPPWGISTGDFHEDGSEGVKLGVYPTTFLVKEFSKKAVLEAMKNGRMYCSLGDSKIWPKLDYFTISEGNEKKSFMGGTLTTAQFPLIRFKISYETKESSPMTFFLIRGGEVIRTFIEKPPFEVEHLDKDIPLRKKTYYRIMDSNKFLTSNPIFVFYNPDSPR